MKLPPLSPGNTEGYSPNCVPQYNQGYDRNNIPGSRNIIPGYFRWLLGGGFRAQCRTPLQPGIDMNVRFPTPQRHWGVRTVWRLSANLGYPGTDYTAPMDDVHGGRCRLRYRGR